MDPLNHNFSAHEDVDQLVCKLSCGCFEVRLPPLLLLLQQINRLLHTVQTLHQPALALRVDRGLGVLLQGSLQFDYLFL